MYLSYTENWPRIYIYDIGTGRQRVVTKSANPSWTLYRMREAAQAGDAEALAPYVDYAGMDARAKAAAPSYFAVPPDTAPADSPGGRRLREFLQGRLAAAPSAPPMSFSDVAPWPSGMPMRIGGFGLSGPHGYRPYINRQGLNEFRVLDERSPDNGGLTFRRHGFGWRLEEVRFSQQ